MSDLPLEHQVTELRNENALLKQRVERLERTAGEVWIAGGNVTAKEVREYVEGRLAALASKVRLDVTAQLRKLKRELNDAKR